jgi:hypothetical protein
MMKHLLVIFFTHWSWWIAPQNGPQWHQLKQKSQPRLKRLEKSAMATTTREQ